MKYLIILLSLVHAAGVYAGSSRCDLCRRTVESRYYVFQSDSRETIVCTNCNDTAGRCGQCGFPVAGTGRHSQDVICSNCRVSAKRCDACGGFLTRTYYVNSSGNSFCLACNDSADRCSMCSTILLPGKWSFEAGRMVCQTCSLNTPRCTGCNDFIAGRYTVYKGFEGVFCLTCSEKSPACISCLRPTGTRPVPMKNGHALCGECALTAVRNTEELNSVIRNVTRFMERNMLMNITRHIEFQLVDDIGRPIHSDHYRESGRFIRRGDLFTIKILRGLSRPICIETVAHEMAHAWQAENGPYLTEEELVEGFAQWVAGKVLTGMGYGDLVERLHYRDDVYGRGYRRLVSMEEHLGFAGVFMEIKRLGKSR